MTRMTSEGGVRVVLAYGPSRVVSAVQVVGDRMAGFVER